MLEILQTKELNSTTKVEGVLVQTSDKKWYAVTRMQPARNPWFLRAAPSTRTGRVSMDDPTYMKKCKGKPTFEEGTQLLIKILNNQEDSPNDKPTYY